MFSANDFERNLVLGSMKAPAPSRRRSIGTACGVALMVLAVASVFAQPATAPLTFEVATIKPSSGDDRRSAMMFQPGGGFRATGITFKMLLTLAYDVREFQISGGPKWIETDRYDITAKAERGATANADSEPPRSMLSMSDQERKTMQEQMAQRLQGLLADRCHLVTHKETKEQQVYALVVGKGGSKLKAASETGERRGLSQGQGPGERQGTPDRPLPGGRAGMMRMGRGDVEGNGPIEFLIRAISSQLGRPVIDRTGLKGNFDIKLQWTPDSGQGSKPFGDAPPPGVEPPPSDPNGPSIFTALQEQLGLRLESQKGPVDLIVIDRVEKPSEN
jgi:bla regulator protein blaR1